MRKHLCDNLLDDRNTQLLDVNVAVKLIADSEVVGQALQNAHQIGQIWDKLALKHRNDVGTWN